jgi:hypothetical protein
MEQTEVTVCRQVHWIQLRMLETAPNTRRGSKTPSFACFANARSNHSIGELFSVHVLGYVYASITASDVVNICRARGSQFFAEFDRNDDGSIRDVQCLSAIDFTGPINQVSWGTKGVHRQLLVFTCDLPGLPNRGLLCPPCGMRRLESAVCHRGTACGKRCDARNLR